MATGAAAGAAAGAAGAICFDHFVLVERDTRLTVRVGRFNKRAVGVLWLCALQAWTGHGSPGMFNGIKVLAPAKAHKPIAALKGILNSHSEAREN